MGSASSIFTSALLGRGAHPFDGLGHHQVDEDGLARRRLLGLDPRQVEQVVDDPADPERLGVDPAGQALGHGGVGLRHQRLGQQPEGAHRCLQLVAHVGHEVTADLLEAPAFGDVVDDGDHPEGAPAVVDQLGPHGQGPPGRPVEVECLVGRARLPRVSQELDHSRRRQRVTVASTHEADGAGVAEDDLPVLVADDDPLGERVERAPQTDGVGRRLGHRLGGTIGDLFQVVERRLHPRRVLLRGLDAEAGGEGRQPLLERAAARPPTKRGGQRDCHQGQRPETDEPGDGDGVGDPPGRADHRSPVHRSPAWQARTCTRRPGPVPHHAVVGSRGARRPTPPGSDAARWLKHEKS